MRFKSTLLAAGLLLASSGHLAAAEYYSFAHLKTQASGFPPGWEPHDGWLGESSLLAGSYQFVAYSGSSGGQLVLPAIPFRGENVFLTLSHAWLLGEGTSRLELSLDGGATWRLLDASECFIGCSAIGSVWTDYSDTSVTHPAATSPTFAFVRLAAASFAKAETAVAQLRFVVTVKGCASPACGYWLSFLNVRHEP